MSEELEVGRGNQKGQICLEALVKQEIIKSASTEALLKELKDRGVIRSWYYNGEYHVGNELPQRLFLNFNRTKV